MADKHETFDEFTLKKIKNGWLVSVKSDHKLKGDWQFKSHDGAVDFVNEGKTSGGARRRFRPVKWFWSLVIAGAIVWVLYYGIPMWLSTS